MRNDSDIPPASRLAHRRGILLRLLPYVSFTALLLYGWRNWGLTGSLPGYGDTLEIVWLLRWFDGVLRGLHSASLYPLAFHPEGWHVASFGQGPGMYAPMLPFYWIGGAAFAYNVMCLLGFLIAFAGMYRLALRFVTRLPATTAALLFTFWGFRWFRVDGHVNILLASALLPWMVWGLERWLNGASRRWLVLVGLLWAATIPYSGYFGFIGGALMVTWLGGYLLARRIRLRSALLGLALPAFIAVLLNAPWLLWFMRESAAANVLPNTATEVSSWDASLNALLAPNMSHPLLHELSRQIYSGPLNEPGLANLGPLACLVALFGASRAGRDRRWWPILLCAPVCFVLALGLRLHWDGDAVQGAALRPLNSALWQLGHALKPTVFTTAQPPESFATAVPLPGLLLSAAVPLMDRARVFARYILPGSIAIYLLAALGIGQLRRTWMQVLLAGLLIFELLPPPTHAVPYPPPSHPAFDWLAAQDIGTDGIIDLGSWQQDTLYIAHQESTVWATDLHRQRTVSGTGSRWPAYVSFLTRWLDENPHAFLNPDLVPLLRSFRVRYVLLHVSGGYARDALAEARQSSYLGAIRCLEPSSTAGPWNYPMCIIDVPPRPDPSTVLFRAGWSGQEEWGRWMEGTEGRAQWVATSQVSHTLKLRAFPFCAPGKTQSLKVTVNGVDVASHEWRDCGEWSATVQIPAPLAQIGWNEVVLSADHALVPSEVTGGANTDTRSLSLGVSLLEVTDAER